MLSWSCIHFSIGSEKVNVTSLSKLMYWGYVGILCECEGQGVGSGVGSVVTEGASRYALTCSFWLCGTFSATLTLRLWQLYPRLVVHGDLIETRHERECTFRTPGIVPVVVVGHNPTFDPFASLVLRYCSWWLGIFGPETVSILHGLQLLGGPHSIGGLSVGARKVEKALRVVRRQAGQGDAGESSELFLV